MSEKISSQIKFKQSTWLSTVKCVCNVADLTREMGFNWLYFQENASMKRLIWSCIMQISKALAHQR